MRKQVGPATEPQSGYGLYVYILPQMETSPDTLAGAEQYAKCLDPSRSGDVLANVALMILPAKPTSNGTAPIGIDIPLSHDLLPDIPGTNPVDPQEIYIIVTNNPLKLGQAPPNGIIAMTVGNLSSDNVRRWLVRLQLLIESGAKIEAPKKWDLRLRSIFRTIGEAASYVGIPSAEAATTSCN